MFPKFYQNGIQNKKSIKKQICMVLPPFTMASGGIISLYKLHDILVSNGYDVYVLPYNPTGPFPYRRDLKILFQNEFDFQLEDLIWIYSDTVTSIPVNAKIQIQWQLNRPGYLPATPLGYHRISPNYVFKYSDVISENIENKLFISNFDFELFKIKKVKQKLHPVYYFGKGSDINVIDFKKYYSHPSRILTRSFPLREELPYFLAASSMLISFDTLSALNIEANLCGTPTLVVVNDKSKFKEIDIRRFELPTSGLVFDFNELEKVPKLDDDYYDNFKEVAYRLEEKTVNQFLSFLEKI
jgi:hypothetical protein